MMKQMKLFKTEKTKKQAKLRWTLYVDGAARNNPGPAGAGVYLVHENKPVVQQGHYLGIKTNNQAEYLALLLGIFYARQHMEHGDMLEIAADSELLVRQMIGQYKVKNPELKRLQCAAFTLLMPLNYTIRHVVREQNKKADALANVGINKKCTVPEAFISLLKEYDILF